MPKPSRTSRGLSLLACLLGACGAATPSGSPAGSGSGADGRGPDHASPAAGHCPHSIDDAESMRCGVGEDRPSDTCSYPEGECSCGRRPVCSGAEEEPIENPGPEVFVWVCRRTPPDVRPDGCPGVMPAAGAACDEVGKRCWYGECCVDPVDCTADGWSEPGMTECPP